MSLLNSTGFSSVVCPRRIKTPRDLEPLRRRRPTSSANRSGPSPQATSSICRRSGPRRFIGSPRLSRCWRSASMRCWACLTNQLLPHQIQGRALAAPRPDPARPRRFIVGQHDPHAGSDHPPRRIRGAASCARSGHRGGSQEESGKRGRRHHEGETLTSSATSARPTQVDIPADGFADSRAVSDGVAISAIGIQTLGL